MTRPQRLHEPKAGLSKRDRSLITVAALVAQYRPEQLRIYSGRALDNGVTQDELGELITHLAFYSGWPTAVIAAGVARKASAYFPVIDLLRNYFKTVGEDDPRARRVRSPATS